MMDMLALLPENSKDRYDSRHRLVIAASQRAKQIMQGSRLTIQTKFTKRRRWRSMKWCKASSST